jgi:MOSC domain-containing protein YiiM
LPDILEQATKTGYTGFYLRVLAEGLVAPGDRMDLLERPTDTLTIAAANAIFYRQREDREALTRLLATPALAEQWRDWATNRLNKS